VKILSCNILAYLWVIRNLKRGNSISVLDEILDVPVSLVEEAIQEIDTGDV
jgi:hypothetical protein